MPASPSPSTRPSRRTAVTAVLAGVVAVVLVAGWVLVTRSGGSDPARPPGPAATSPAAVDLSALTVRRAAFCDRLDDTDVSSALDAQVAGSDDYRSGDRVLLAAGLRDVSHEFGCTFSAATGARARVWVFAEPVTVAEAVRIGRGVRRQRGCRPVGASPAFGRAPAGTVCRVRSGRQVTLRGLFGDAWLSCQLTTASPRAAAVRRAGRWCVGVATAVGSP